MTWGFQTTKGSHLAAGLVPLAPDIQEVVFLQRPFDQEVQESCQAYQRIYAAENEAKQYNNGVIRHLHRQQRIAYMSLSGHTDQRICLNKENGG